MFYKNKIDELYRITEAQANMIFTLQEKNEQVINMLTNVSEQLLRLDNRMMHLSVILDELEQQKRNVKRNGR